MSKYQAKVSIAKGQSTKLLEKKFSSVLKIKGKLEKAWQAEYKEDVRIAQGDIDRISMALKLQPQLAIIDSQLNAVIHTFAITAVASDFPDVIKLIISEKLLDCVTYPILNMAVSKGHNKVVKLLVPHIKLDTQSAVTDMNQGVTMVTDGYTPVHEAARVGNIEAFTIMYLKNNNVLKFYSDVYCLNPFHIALKFNQFNIAQTMVRIDPSIVDSRIKVPGKYTALHAAAANNNLADSSTGLQGNIEIVKFLVKNNALLDTLASGYTPIHDAVRAGNTEAFNIMRLKALEQNKNVFEFYSDDGLNPFHVALRFNKFNIAQTMVKIDPSIVNSRMSIKGQMFKDPTALHMGASNALADPLTGPTGNIKIVKFLIKNQAIIDVLTGITIDERFGMVTPLSGSVMAPDPSYVVIKILLKARAKIRAVNEEADDPFLQAVKNDNPKVIELLMEFGGEDIYDKDGYLEALELSVIASKLKIFEFLIKKYPDAKIKSSWFTPMLLQQDQETIEFFYSLLKNPIHILRFNEAISFVIGDAYLRLEAPDLLEKSMELTSHTTKGNQLAKSLDETLEFLNQNPITSPIFKEENYCLDTAALLGSIKLFKQLIAMGAKISLLKAVTVRSLINEGYESFLNELIAIYKIDIMSYKSPVFGMTVAHLAALCGKPNVLKILKKEGALLDEEDSFGFTPLHYAEYRDDRECIQLLKERGFNGVPSVDDNQLPPLLEERNGVDNAEEEYTPPTQAEEARSISIEQQIHRLYQEQKAKLKELSKFQKQKETEESWVIPSSNGRQDEKYSESEKDSDSGAVFKVYGHEGKVTYFAIPNSLGLNGELLDKFKTAIEVGFVGPCGKSGVKVFRKKISQHESVETLYELKIYSSQYGNQRLYTQEKYINANKSELIVFKALGNHREVALAGRESEGILVHMVDNAVELRDQETLQSNKVLTREIGCLLEQYLGEAEEKGQAEIKMAGDSDGGEVVEV